MDMIKKHNMEEIARDYYGMPHSINNHSVRTFKVDWLLMYIHVDRCTDVGYYRVYDVTKAYSPSPAPKTITPKLLFDFDNMSWGKALKYIDDKLNSEYNLA